MSQSDAERAHLEAQADKLLTSPRAKQARWRIENSRFDEEAGRAMYQNVPRGPGKSRSRAVDWDCRTPLPVEAGGDVVRHCLFGGRTTPGAILSRLCAMAVRMGEISLAEAARISGKSPRTLRRNGQS